MTRLILCLFLACLLPTFAVAEPGIEAAARKILSGLQERSIRNNREYCGVLLRREDGSLVSSEAFGGTRSRCRVKRIPMDGEVVASYHTHGAFLPGYDNEVPSVIDLEVEMEWGIQGYVATPGGRFWRVDGVRGVVSLICGPRCLPYDSRFPEQPRQFGKVRETYTMEELIRRSRMSDFFD